MSFESVSHPTISSILCLPFILLSVFPSIRVFSNESALHVRWPKYWNFGFSISSSNEYSVLISFIFNWFDLLAVQGILKSFLQYCHLKSSILWLSAFFIAQLSHQYMTTGKTIALTIQAFVYQVMSLLFNMLSRLIIAFPRRNKCLNFMAAVTICSDFGAPKNSLTLFPLFPHLFPMKWWDQMPWS